MRQFKKKIVITLILITSIYLVYSQSFNFDFINFDDPVYVTDNPAVKRGLAYESLKWAFGIHGDICMYYQPFAWISHMADCQWFGLEPGKHHRTSVIIHGFNAVMLFLILHGLTGSLFRSAFAAGIFALHPVNTDAVIWISERKTVLSAFFWLSAMGLYIIYTRKPSAWRFLFVVVFFALGMFTKPVLITFPFAMILMDIYPLERLKIYPKPSLGRIATLFAEKTPLFIVIVCWSVTPYLSETLLANETTPDIIPYGLRISNVFVSYSKYVIKFFFPFHLSILYPYPETIPLLYTIASFLFLIVITVFLVIRFRSQPGLLIGWLWFAGTLFPTSGLILGTLWPEMADRWAYIPYIGLAMMTAWGLPGISTLSCNLASKVIAGISLAFLLYLGTLAYKQTEYWENSISIFKKALSVIDYHALPHQNIASEWIRKGEFDKAKKHLEIILKNEPNHVDALYNMGLCMVETNRPIKGLDYFNTVLSLDPGYTRAYLFKARILEMEGRNDDIIAMYKQALDHSLKQNDILLNLSLILSREGKIEEAEQYFIKLLSAYPMDSHANGAFADFLIGRQSYKKALHYALIQSSITPDSAEAHNRSGLCFIHLANFEQAIMHFTRAIDIDDQFLEAKVNLQTAVKDQNDLNKALEAIKKEFEPGVAEDLPSDPAIMEQWLDSKLNHEIDGDKRLSIIANLAKIYRIYGNYGKALDLYRSLLNRYPGYETSLNYNMACVYALLNQPKDAVLHLARAIHKDPSFVKYIDKDRDFDSIRQTDAFSAFRESLQTN